MPDSETPQPDNPAGDPAAGPPEGGPGSFSPKPAESPAAPAAEPQSDADAAQSAGAPDSAPDGSATGSSGRDPRARFANLAHSRALAWGAVALACIAAGTVASVLGARSVAHSDANKARQASRQTSADIASTLKLAIQHEEDFAIGASTFFSGNPKAKPAEFEAWARYGDGFHRYPELAKLSLVTLVPASGLAAFEAKLSGHPPKAPTLTRRTVKGVRVLVSTPAAPTLHVVPAGKRPVYCFALASLPRSSARYTPAGLDLCAVTPGLLASRDSAKDLYSSIVANRTPAVGIARPVYKGGVPPTGFSARRDAFVGWLREVLLPTVVLKQALQGHPEGAVRLRHRTGSSSAVFAGGAPRPGAESTIANLHGGWSARTYGGPVDAGVLADWHAVVLLIAGILLSLMLALLVVVLGAGRPRAAAPAPRAREVPHEDLYDPLTGLPNRALMMDRAQRTLARASRESGLLAGALFIDIDWFENVNDKLGQAAGDELLTTVAERLETVIRAGDTVGRLGGDEFVILVESAARGARLDSLARRVIEALHKPVTIEGFGPSIFLTASIGVAFGRYATPDELLHDARLALEASKAAGKDRYTLFNANMRSVIEGRGVLEVELNAALESKQLFLLYEAVQDLAHHKVAGLEALLRWRHPTQGVLGPESFMALAEETGLSVPIGRWMLEEAATMAAAWNVAGHRVSVSVPVTANQLGRDGLATDVRRALLQSGIEPSLLTLEISESSVMRDIEVVAARLQEMKQLGVRIAIDDFGSGYAHHSDLQRLPLDFLIVDRGSLAASDDEDYRSWLLQAILVLGRDLSLTVIAKGVGSQEELLRLQTMGCTLAQGPFLGEPVPAEAVVERLLDDGLPTGTIPERGQYTT
ncbi:MAG TPA: bifunctional diguanylate cyclase/phosphodiesterase [Solirubrobacteraceae bacterium]|jgi:diguanylate cyclase (GGDEF)-like protein|nr:bifunctional diguanylate cyclase/phosphodiesterase [Solirubrobacteraceae bacterium]